MNKKLNELVERLTREQQVEFSRPAKKADALKQSIDREYVHIMFKATGTEVGMQLSKNASDLTATNFENQTGKARLVGALTLNYNKVKCVADIDLETCEGNGYLVPIDDAEYATFIK